MKQSKRVALCGVLAALAVVIMLMAYFPYLTYALPALSGALLAVVLFEINGKWAFGTFVAAGVLTVLLCEKEAAVLFIAVFGYYPILKSFLERIPFRPLEYLIKFVIFNAAMVAAYLFIIFVFGIPLEGMELFGPYTLWVLLAIANGMFILYDLALSLVYADYMRKIHPKIAKLLR